ncbi:MAG: TrkH family potassium uptake protein [Acutalibacteraceae bacterium]|nr:TrkH family potassium uptake protein [Acutalibacteraceae bacterium]
MTKKMLRPKKNSISSFQIITLGFLCVILLGSVLLMLPVAASNGKATSFLDALFTSVSATCVTGLVVLDTATHWSAFGQAVIALLIQIGGLGVVTITVSMVLFAGKKVGLRQRNTLRESVSAPDTGRVINLIKFILIVTVIAELLGACLLATVFCKDFGPLKGIWYACFHSVSAFCNAGFDLMGITGEFSSLSGYSDNVVVNLVVCSLILVGGIGFLTWDDVRHHGIHIKKYRLQSKLIFLMTFILVVFPFLFYYFNEFAKTDMPTGEKVLAALFQSVTPRTAGFNTVDLASFNGSSQALMIVQMLIGGAPGSTAGGVKVTTMAVLFMTVFSVVRRKEDTESFGRRIDDNTVKYALTVLLIYLSMFFVSGIVISCIEQLPLSACLFETASAIGTVGLTLGITTELCAASRLILIVLMFLGRVGGLTIAFAGLSNKVRNVSKLPEEKITVG